MTLLTEAPSSNAVPQIVRVILTHVDRQRRDGDITPATYDEKVSRLKREELGPRGFVLLETPMDGGRTRYLIKEGRTGAVRDTVECGPAVSRGRRSRPRRSRPEHGDS